uniref:CD109 molecule n=1 Tax=Oryzias latipes TaxID=8090 RepID=A0A3P9JXP8_ORYLA
AQTDPQRILPSFKMTKGEWYQVTKWSLKFWKNLQIRKLSPVKLNRKGVLKQINNSLLFVFLKNGALFLLQVNDGEANNNYPYVLEVKGYVGKSLLFSNSTNLSFDPKGCTTFIQTDKLNYLPGQVVKIRAVLFLRFYDSCFSLIKDPRGNFIRQWQNKESNLGVVSTEFELSENPPLGQWTILTEVKVSTSRHRINKEGKVYCLKRDILTGSKQMQVYDLHCIFNMLCFVNSCHFSGLTYSETMKVSLIEQKYKIVFEDFPKTLKPSQNFTATVSLSWSSSPRKPAEDVTLKVSVAEPGSLVGLLVVDRSTQGANTDNDIHEETVITKLFKFYIFFLFFLDFFKLTLMKDFFYFCRDSHTVKLPLTVPDSITSWTATAFVMSEHLGLGITEEPATLTVFQDFFLSLNLPPYVIRGEDLVLEIILFNYLQQDQEVSLLCVENQLFLSKFRINVRQVHVASGGGTNVLVPIRPLVLGEIPISVKATSFESSDFISTTVLVKAEGLEQTFSSSVLLELSAGQMNLSKIVAFTFPPDVVVGSERASVTAIGDILGPSISGLDSLIQMPYGCGEQNMIHLAPNIFILQYLTLTGQDDPEITKRATDYMMRGYEQELSFQRADGSFSAFGDSDASGSTWLSAFVLKCFLQAQKFIVIDSNVLLRVASWISAQQGADGRFEEPGRVIHTELQGGLDGSVSLTAYVLIALLETRYANEVSSALMYLETRVAMGGVPSNYSLSLVTYALALAGNGLPMWSSPNAGLSPSWQPTSADIETMSYLLLSLHKLNHIPDGLELMKALSQQRNSMGGYGSTQDTIVALQALSTFAAAVGSHPSDLNIKVTSINSGRGTTFHINQENYLVHQMQQVWEFRVELIRSSIWEIIHIILLLNVFYNIKNEKLMRQRRDADSHEAFIMYIELSDINVDLAQLSICMGLNATGMAIMEVGLLSGFLLQEPGVSLNDVVKKVEVQPGKVIVYLDSVKEMCLLIPLMVEYKVAKVQEVAVILYDYYEPRETERMYTSEWRNSMSTCSFCGDDCSQCQANDNDITVLSHGSRLLSLICFPLIPVLLFILIM